MRWRTLVAFLFTLALTAGVAAPAWAGAGTDVVFDTYSRLAGAGASPAPLVFPTLAAPRADELLEDSGNAERGGKPYVLRLVWRMRNAPFTPRAIVELRRARVRTLRALRGQLRFGGFSARPIRIRNRPGLLFTRTVSPGFHLAWVEGGLVYELLTGQPRRVPLRALRWMAGTLEPISGVFAGSVELPDGPTIPRGHTTPPRPVHLPHGWLDHPDDATPPSPEADEIVSGG